MGGPSGSVAFNSRCRHMASESTCTRMAQSTRGSGSLTNKPDKECIICTLQLLWTCSTYAPRYRPNKTYY
eukprot:1797197-Amphidinium_carterae.1